MDLKDKLIDGLVDSLGKEIKDKIEWLRLYQPIIVKYGRYIPNQASHYDSILGVKLASPNQYAEVIS